MSGLTQRKAARMESAAQLKWGEDMTHKEIAEELELSKSTIDQYFSSDHMENFQRIWSDKEKFELQRILEQQLYDIEQEAKEKIRSGANHPEASGADKIRAGKEMMNTLRRKIELLQELGVVQKPKERKEVEEKKSGEPVTFEMRYTNPENEEERQEQQEEEVEEK